MRTTLTVLFIMLATQLSSETASGMLACNPNDKSKEPVIYAFDGKFLLRDNNPKFPYKNVLTIAENIYLYFGFELSGYALADFERKYKKYEKMKTQSWKIRAEINNFKRYCQGSPDNSSYYNFILFKASQKSLRAKNQCIDYLTKQNRCVNITDVDYQLGASELCGNVSNLEEKYMNFKEPQLVFEDFDQVKLTIDLNSMEVIEERITTEWISLPQRFVCKSLGTPTPELDRTQSVTPILKNI